MIVHDGFYGLKKNTRLKRVPTYCYYFQSERKHAGDATCTRPHAHTHTHTHTKTRTQETAPTTALKR